MLEVVVVELSQKAKPERTALVGALMTQCKIEFTYQSQKPLTLKVVLEW